jgi:YbbR domain-containing protein
MLRDLLIKDFGWKLFSLLLAAFIWYTVHKLIEEPGKAAVSLVNRTDTFGNVPVFIVAETELRQYGLNSNNVSVTVTGPPEVMDGLQLNQIHATVDLTGFNGKPKEMDRRVEVSVPWGVTVVEVEPAEVTLIPAKR